MFTKQLSQSLKIVKFNVFPKVGTAGIPWGYDQIESCIRAPVLLDLLNLLEEIDKMTCASSENSYQPGHPPSRIRVLTVRMKKAWVLSHPLST